MRYSTIIGLAACLASGVASAQQQAPVVLVWGEYLAQANEREAPGTRSYMDNIASALDAVGLAYDRAKDSDVETGALRGYKFAIFPYNAHLSDTEHEAIRQFVAAGGKIWASFTQDPVLNELLGVRVRGSARPEYEGYYSFMRFTEQAPQGVPRSVAAGSWYSHEITLAPGTEVIATWADADAKDTGMPALTQNENGYYHCHVMLGEDTEAKGQMFLALIGHFFPELWQQAVRQAIGKIADIHGYGSWESVAEAINQAKAQGRDASAAEARLEDATKAKDAAEALFKDGRYAEALEKARKAKELLRSATYPLARSREGELRAVWISGARVDDWEAVMQDLESAGFNAIFPHMCDAGGAEYESDVLPKSRDYKRDQLAACIEAAQRHNIEVHVWRVNWRIARGTDERKAELREAGRLTKSVDGADGDWLCPSDERNFKLEAAAMLELVEKYPVQGIHFDYIRYHNSKFCYCEKCQANFERDAGVKVENWPQDVLAGGPFYDRFQDWRREQITRLVREVYKRAHAMRPDIVVSAAVFTNWPASRVSIGQDAAAWSEEGVIDLLIPMTYTNSNEALAERTKQHIELNKGRAILAEGIGAFSSHSQFTGPDQLIQQIETARQLGADGFCVFHYGTGLKRGFLPALAEGCTGPRTFTPMLRPPASFELEGTAKDWFSPEGQEISATATVEGKGPWGKRIDSLEAELLLQGLDGRTIRPLAPKKNVQAGAQARWSRKLEPKPGAYRLAILGQVKFEDGSTCPYICRSRPFHVLLRDEFDLRQGKLPPPSEPQGKPRVGILIDGYGGQGVLAALQEVPGLDLVPASQISADLARECQAIIVTQGRNGPSVDSNIACALRNWIAAGGAVLTTHDAVGYRGHVPICPEICKGGLTHERSTTIMTTDSPLVPVEYRAAVFQHAFYDHIILDPGEQGEVVVTDEQGKPVVVVGKVGKGRFAASGVAFGLNADTVEEKPGDDEAELLRQLILWLLAEH